MSANLELSWMLVAHLALTGLPGVAAALLATRRGLRDTPLLLAVALAASGAAAILSFWAFYLDPVVGQTVSFLVILASLQGIVLCWRGGLDFAVLRELVPPLALWALASGFVLFLGFLHGGTEIPLFTAQTRFSHPLPFDNVLPRFFANWFYLHGHSSRPPDLGGWLASDRPPLQMGYVVGQRPFGWDARTLHYQVIGVVLQQLWVVGMWGILSAARLRAVARGLVMFAVLASDVIIVHGFFVWPKLLAAAFLLAAVSVVISPAWERLRGDYRVAALLGALLGFAMLAHGSSAFFILPLLAFAGWKAMSDWRWLGVFALVGIALLAPWSAYQKWGDPPGDRLIKWQLGGVLDIDDRGSLETILDSYREEGVGGALDNKWGNVTEILGTKWDEPAAREIVDDIGSGHLGDAASALRTPRFYSLISFLGLLLVAPVGMVVARMRGRPTGPEWDFSVFSFGFSLAVCAIWVLLMFGGPIASTQIHVGAMAIPILLVAACVSGAYALSKRFAVALVVINAILVLATYAPALLPPEGTSYSPPALFLAAACLGGYAFVALRWTAR